MVESGGLYGELHGRALNVHAAAATASRRCDPGSTLLPRCCRSTVPQCWCWCCCYCLVVHPVLPPCSAAAPMPLTPRIPWLSPMQRRCGGASWRRGLLRPPAPLPRGQRQWCRCRSCRAPQTEGTLAPKPLINAAFIEVLQVGPAAAEAPAVASVPPAPAAPLLAPTSAAIALLSCCPSSCTYLSVLPSVIISLAHELERQR